MVGDQVNSPQGNLGPGGKRETGLFSYCITDADTSIPQPHRKASLGILMEHGCLEVFGKLFFFHENSNSK